MPLATAVSGLEDSETSAFLQNILESSTEYSVIGKDLEGKILLGNEGARRLYGYEPEEVVGQANSSIRHVPEDVRAGRHQEIVQAALRDGKWEGTHLSVRKNGQRFTARVDPEKLGVDAFLRKPCTAETLVRIVGETLGA